MSTPEGNIQRAICDYLSLRGYMFWRSNNMPVFDRTRGAYRAMPKYTPKGLPDIVVIDGGHFIGLEVKTAKNYQSPDQKTFQKKLEEAGGSYYVVRSIDDVQKIGL